jgi:membrane-associated phospholipid phosphatase
VIHLHFDMGVMAFLASHRTPALTRFFLLASDLGEVQGYILITTLIYVAFDKRLALKLSLLVSLTMCLNHVLKIVIKNPRPFVLEGDYLQKWAVPIDNARDLATEWSSPSGHAMAAGSFYSFLYGCVRNRSVRILAVLAILLIGASRPYLGVHYVEDILLGWAIGLGVGLVALRYGGQLGMAWAKLTYSHQIGIAVAASAVLWVITVFINGNGIGGQPRAFLGYAGSITGLVIAWPLERRFVDFDPRSSSIFFKALRYLLSVAISLVTLALLKRAFGAIAGDYSIGGYLLQYLRYVAIGVVSFFVAPWIFTRLRLAKSLQAMSPYPPAS